METKQHPATHKKTLCLLLAAALLLLAGAGLWYVRAADPSGQSLLPPCLFHSFTGLWCTGCGITRALHHILNGHLYAGFRMNPLAVLCLPVFAWLAATICYRLYKGRPLPKVPLWLPWVALAVILVYTVARNLPWEPFSWLAPTEVPWVR